MRNISPLKILFMWDSKNFLLRQLNESYTSKELIILTKSVIDKEQILLFVVIEGLIH